MNRILVREIFIQSMSDCLARNPPSSPPLLSILKDQTLLLLFLASWMDLSDSLLSQRPLANLGHVLLAVLSLQSHAKALCFFRMGESRNHCVQNLSCVNESLAKIVIRSNKDAQPLLLIDNTKGQAFPTQSQVDSPMPGVPYCPTTA